VVADGNVLCPVPAEPGSPARDVVLAPVETWAFIIAYGAVAVAVSPPADGATDADHAASSSRVISNPSAERVHALISRHVYAAGGHGGGGSLTLQTVKDVLYHAHTADSALFGGGGPQRSSLTWAIAALEHHLAAAKADPNLASWLSTLLPRLSTTSSWPTLTLRPRRAVEPGDADMGAAKVIPGTLDQLVSGQLHAAVVAKADLRHVTKALALLQRSEFTARRYHTSVADGSTTITYTCLRAAKPGGGSGGGGGAAEADGSAGGVAGNHGGGLSTRAGSGIGGMPEQGAEDGEVNEDSSDSESDSSFSGSDAETDSDAASGAEGVVAGSRGGAVGSGGAAGPQPAASAAPPEGATVGATATAIRNSMRRGARRRVGARDCVGVGCPGELTIVYASTPVSTLAVVVLRPHASHTLGSMADDRHHALHPHIYHVIGRLTNNQGRLGPEAVGTVQTFNRLWMQQERANADRVACGQRPVPLRDERRSTMLSPARVVGFYGDARKRDAASAAEPAVADAALANAVPLASLRLCVCGTSASDWVVGAPFLQCASQLCAYQLYHPACAGVAEDDAARVRQTGKWFCPACLSVPTDDGDGDSADAPAPVDSAAPAAAAVAVSAPQSAAAAAAAGAPARPPEASSTSAADRAAPVTGRPGRSRATVNYAQLGTVGHVSSGGDGDGDGNGAWSAGGSHTQRLQHPGGQSVPSAPVLALSAMSLTMRARKAVSPAVPKAQPAATADAPPGSAAASAASATGADADDEDEAGLAARLRDLDLPDRASCYRLNIVKSVVKTAANTTRRKDRGGLPVAQALLATLNEWQQHPEAWAKVEVLSVDARSGEVKALRAAVVSPDMRENLLRYRGICEVQVGDATFGLTKKGRVNLHAILGIEPTSGYAVPLVFGVFMDQGKRVGEDAESMLWLYEFLGQLRADATAAAGPAAAPAAAAAAGAAGSAQPGRWQPAAMYFVDKARGPIIAFLQHLLRQLHGDDGAAERAGVLQQLDTLAAGATDVEVEAARYFCSNLGGAGVATMDWRAAVAGVGGGAAAGSSGVAAAAGGSAAEPLLEPLPAGGSGGAAAGGQADAGLPVLGHGAVDMGIDPTGGSEGSVGAAGGGSAAGATSNGGAGGDAAAGGGSGGSEPQGGQQPGRQPSLPPPSPADLLLRFPGLAAAGQPALPAAGADGVFPFSQGIRKDYGFLVRGLAAHTAATLRDVQAQLEDMDYPDMAATAGRAADAAAEEEDGAAAAATMGMWMMINARLLPLLAVLSVEGRPSRYLRRYHTPTVGLCYFHAWQAMLRWLTKKDSGVMAALRMGLLEGFKSIVYSAAPDTLPGMYAKYKAAWPGCDAWFEYLEKHWLCPEWAPLLFGFVRDRVPRYNINTTNPVELLWNIIKKFWMNGMEALEFGRALTQLVGRPDDPDSQDASLVGITCKQIDEVKAGITTAPPRKCADLLAAHMTQLLDCVIQGGAAAMECESPELGVYRFTAAAAGTWRFTRGHGSGSQPRAVPATECHDKRADIHAIATDDDLLAGSGREDGVAVAQTVARALELRPSAQKRAHAAALAAPGAAASAVASAAADSGAAAAGVVAPPAALAAAAAGGSAGKGAGAASDPGGAEGGRPADLWMPAAEDVRAQLANAVMAAAALPSSFARSHDQLAPPPSLGATRQATQRLLAVRTAAVARVLEYAPRPFVEAVAALHAARQALPVHCSLSDRVRINQQARAAVTAAGPALRRSDFDRERGRRAQRQLPHVGLVYAVQVTMQAQHWHAECERVLVRGDCQSRMFRCEVSMDYRVTLRDVQELAAGLVAAGLGAQELTGLYVGREMKGASSSDMFTRVWEHAAAGGNDNIAEVVFITRRVVGQGRRCEPLGPVTLERRTLFLLPPDTDQVDLAEALGLVLLVGDTSTGFFFNNSPTGESKRYTQPGHDGRPSKSDELGADFLRKVAQRLEPNALQTAEIDEVECAFMRRYLHAVEYLIGRGFYVADAASPASPPVALDLSAKPHRGEPARSSFLQAWTAWKETAETQATHTVYLFCGICTCRAAAGGRLCKHTLVARAAHLVSDRPLLWTDRELELYVDIAALIRGVESALAPGVPPRHRHVRQALAARGSGGAAGGAGAAGAGGETMAVDPAVGWAVTVAQLDHEIDALRSTLDQYRQLLEAGGDDARATLLGLFSDPRRLKKLSQAAPHAQQARAALAAAVTGQVVRATPAAPVAATLRKAARSAAEVAAEEAGASPVVMPGIAWQLYAAAAAPGTGSTRPPLPLGSPVVPATPAARLLGGAGPPESAQHASAAALAAAGRAPAPALPVTTAASLGLARSPAGAAASGGLGMGQPGVDDGFTSAGGQSDVVMGGMGHPTAEAPAGVGGKRRAGTALGAAEPAGAPEAARGDGGSDGATLGESSRATKRARR
jgi:hypothetical protein